MSGAGYRVRRACADLWEAFTRTKTVDVHRIQETELKRCLGVVDLTALGVGSTLGAGIYLLTGQVARYQAGPSVVLSFLIAAVASLLAGLCYAEFAARVPRAGSAYIYSYVSVGEFGAFVIGWNMILENVIGAASGGKAWSQYFDAILNDTIRHSIEQNVGTFRSPGLASYPDFLAVALLITTTLLVSIGVKMSSVVSFVLTVLNILVIFCIIFIGFFHVDGHNWTDPPGFFPFGMHGVLSGAATCFYAFIGFDTIATSGEEARNPSKNIPSAIVATLIICFLAYFGVSAVLTLMVPWYRLSDEAALPKAFAQCGVVGAEYVVAVGGMCGLAASMMGSIFPLPRILYAMAQDGLIFRFLGSVNSWTCTPLVATVVSGLMAATLALLLDLDSLVQMMSIGTLMAYTLVAASVLVLRYQRDQVGLTSGDMHEDLDLPPSLRRDDSVLSEVPPPSTTENLMTEDTGLLRVGDDVRRVQYVPKQQTTVFKRVSSQDDEAVASRTQSPSRAPREVVEEVRTKQEAEILHRMAKYMSNKDAPLDSTYQHVGSDYSLSSLAQFFNLTDDSCPEPTEASRRRAMVAMTIAVVLWTAFCLLTIYGARYVANATWWSMLLITIFLLIVICFLVILTRQPRNQAKLAFKTPFVPLIPMASIMINIYLMLTLSSATWLRFIVWMALGLLVYFGYGIHNSSERRAEDQEVILYDIADTDSILNNHTYRCVLPFNTLKLIKGKEMELNNNHLKKVYTFFMGTMFNLIK